MSERITLVVNQHGSKTTFEKTDYYCMNCGKQQVWEDDCDDYYQGTGMHCTACFSKWQNPSGVNDSENAPKLLAAIPTSD
jgi:DNA-directed RNA polymerase subunit RPC12/RpoP